MRRFFGLACLAAALLFTGGCAMGEATGTNTVTGNQHLEEENYSAAAASFEDAVQTGEEPVPAYRGLGMAYMGLGQYEDAASAFSAALEEAENDGKMPQTEIDLRLYLASAYYRAGEYEATASVCDDLLAEEEGICADAYFLRGASYLKQSQQEDAKADFNAATDLEPADYTLYLNIYECYDEMNLSGLGSEYLQQALNLYGDTMEDAYHRGRIYYYLEEYATAQSELIHPVEAGHEDAMYLMGRVYLAMEDYTHAKNIYEQIRTTFGESAECCNGFAMCSMEEGDYDQALVWIAQGLAMEGNTGKQELYFNEIAAYEAKLDFETAARKAKEYVERYPSDERGKKELEFLQTR